MLSLSLRLTEKCDKQVYSCAINIEGFIAAGCADGSITLVKPDGTCKLTHHRMPVTAVVFSKEYLVSASCDHSIVLWNIHTSEIVCKLMHHSCPVRCLCTSKDGSLLISGSGDQTIGITNMLAKPPILMQHLRQTESDSGMMSGLCMCDDNSFVISTTTSGSVYLHEVNTVKPKFCVYDAHEMGVNGCDVIRFNEQQLLCTVGGDYKIKLWNIEIAKQSLKHTQTLSGHTGQVLCVRFYISNNNQHFIFTGSVDKSVIIWDVDTGEKLHQSICHSAFIYALCIVDDQLVTCSSDKTIKCWSIGTGTVKTVNVIPIAHQDKLQDWSNNQVQSWLEKLLPEHTTTLTGADLLTQDLDNIVKNMTGNPQLREKVKRSVVLLRCFEGLPTEFLCPISMDIMTDPVVTSDGHSYERSNIMEWLSAGHSTSPFTNTTLTTTSLLSNHNLRKLIQTLFF